VDWNNDKSLDMAVVAEDNRTVVIYFWGEGASSFYIAGNYSFPAPIVSAVSADLNRDGRPDLVAALSNGALAFLDGATGNITELTISNGPILAHPTAPQLNVLDVIGHCGMLDLVILSTNNSFYLLSNTLRTSTVACDYVGGIPTFTATWLSDMPSFRLGVGTAGVDFNGDCKSDFMYPSSYSDANGGIVTYGLNDGGSINPKWLSVPAFVGIPTFADINGDGAVDIMFPSCHTPLNDTSSGTIVYECAHYNTIMVLFNDLAGSDVCGSSCCSGHNSGFASGSYDAAANTIVGVGRGLLTHNPFGCASFIPQNNSGVIHIGPAEPALINTPQYPAVLRPTEVNKDERVDIIISTVWGPMVLASQGGGSFSCAPADASKLTLERHDTLYLNSIVYGFDLQEDGSVDLVGFGTQQTKGGLGMIAYFNGIDTGENYFLTALMTNGVEGGGSPYPAWGSLQVGAVHRFQWQDIDTNLKTASMTQQATSAGFALPMGRCHFGLGMTFSYIQGYSTGLRITSSKGYQLWSAYLVPNSQVVVLANPITDPSSWVLKLFLYPSRFKQLILVALPTSLALIGIPILLLKCKEVRDDRREKRDEMH
jgi:integrin alpha FG-GAP repeat containing protein 1